MHPVRRRPTPHHQGHQDKYIAPLRVDGSDPRRGAQPARRGALARALFVFPTMILVLATLGFDPTWGRFMACVGLLLLGIFVVLSWFDPSRPRRLAFRILYVGGVLAYVATLFV